MIEIVIYKSQGGRSLVKQFSNSYLYGGAPSYLSDSAFTVATNLAVAESRIYFDDTAFMRLVIRQLDANMNQVAGETRTVPLNNVGANQLDVGSKIAAPNFVVAYQKSVLVGRPAISLYRNAITTDEYNTYAETGTVPTRLNLPFAPGALPSMAFTTAILQAEGDTGLNLMLPINARYAAGAVRPVQGLAFAGVRFRQETFDKESGAENMAEAVQQLINENATAIRRLVRQLTGATGDILAAIGQAIVSLVLEALGRYALLAIAQRARIVWPAIYAASQVAQLMQSNPT